MPFYCPRSDSHLQPLEESLLDQKTDSNYNDDKHPLNQFEFGLQVGYFKFYFRHEAGYPDFDIGDVIFCG